MSGNKLCPNCKEVIGSQESTCDVCRMYETGRSDARLYPILALIACWALIPIFTGILLSYMGSKEETIVLQDAEQLKRPRVEELKTPKNVSLDRWAKIRLVIANPGSNAYGRVRLSFPQFDQLDDLDRIRLVSCSEGDIPGVTMDPVGGVIQMSSGKPRISSRWSISFSDFSWESKEVVILEIRVKPKQLGTFKVLYGAALSTDSTPWYELERELPFDRDEEACLQKSLKIEVLPKGEEQ